MALATNLENYPAASLVLVKPSQGKGQQALNLSPTDGSDVSYAQLMQMIYALMMMVGENMSIIQNCYAQAQSDQAQIAQKQSEETSSETQSYLKKLGELEKQQAKSEQDQTVSTVFKWIAVSVSILVGALLCETGVGFAILAATIAVTSTPWFSNAVKSLGDDIGNEIGSQAWGNIIAEVIVLVVLTVATAGAEGAETSIIQKLTSGADEAATKLTSQAATDVEEASAEAISQEATESVSQETNSGTSIKDLISKAISKVRPNYATASVFTQTLLSTNLLGDFIQQIVNQTSLSQNGKKWVTLIATVMADLLVAALTFKMASSDGTSILSKLSSTSLFGVKQAASQGNFIAQSTANLSQGNVGYDTYQTGEVQKELAPLQSNLTFSQSLFDVLTQIANQGQSMYKSIMESNKILFSTDFSANWKATVEAQQQLQG